MQHELDHAARGALTGRHAAFAQHSRTALRYAPEFGPFAGPAGHAPDQLADLWGLAGGDHPTALFTCDELAFPDCLTCLRRGRLHEMLLPAMPPTDARPAPPIRELTQSDVPAMMQLVALTNPGPFAERTIELGRYIGVFEDATLLAMAGERINLDGYTEISAVCTHPSQRGRGLARALIANAAHAIFARGDLPFLHVFAENEPALAVYRRMGFETRHIMHLAVVAQATAAAVAPRHTELA
ncbi:GNAT family N-acetyltransferase [Acidisphaera sp. L21]|uniref:GNAT family N-acetyltransferase n=1 Tax=Acidisphaera sp. L21 TaxID=1641851 RepID=UPI00131E2639|nr:GNAT family N-acetyltransferase [Acidisphaera sp. L21]